MANPNDPLTPEERRRLEEARLENRRVVTDDTGAGAGWFAWWWIWLIIILFIVWFAGWGWGGYGGWFGWGGPRYTTVRPAAAPVGTYNNQRAANGRVGGTAQPNQVENVPAMVNSNNKQQLVGANVNLQHVKVQAVTPNGAVWVGPNANQKVLVVQSAANTGNANNIKPGENVTVQGTVAKVTGANQIQQQWNLKPQEAQQAEKDGIYIVAQSIEPMQQQ